MAHTKLMPSCGQSQAADDADDDNFIGTQERDIETKTKEIKFNRKCV